VTSTSECPDDAAYYEDQIINDDIIRSSVTRVSIVMSQDSVDYSDKTELEVLFESLMEKLYGRQESTIPEGPNTTKSQDDIFRATETLLPIVRMDFEDGRKEDLIDIYTVCNDIMTAKVMDKLDKDSIICEFLVLVNQRLLVWDVLVPSEKLLALSTSYLEQFPETPMISKTRSLLGLCKADLYRRQGRLNDSLKLVQESEEKFQTPDDTLKTYGLTVKSLTLSNMLQKDAAAREAEVALKILKERNDSFSNAVKSELAFIFRFRNTMGALKALEQVCGIVSLREGDEQSVRVRNARVRLGMWYFLDADFDRSITLWRSVIVLDTDFYGDALSLPPGTSVESILGLNYLGFNLSNLNQHCVRNAALKALMIIHFFRQRVLGAYHPSAKFIEKWLTYYILQ